MSHDDTVGFDIIDTRTVNGEMERTKAFVDALSNDIARWRKGKADNSWTPEQQSFYTRWFQWEPAYRKWHQQNYPLTPFVDGAVVSSRSTENAQWQKEAEDLQAQFRSVGGTSTGKAPDRPDTGGSFLGGMSTGAILALALMAYLALKGKRE